MNFIMAIAILSTAACAIVSLIAGAVFSIRFAVLRTFSGVDLAVSLLCGTVAGAIVLFVITFR